MISPKIFSGSTSSSKMYSEDVFSTYVYTGNGSGLTVNNNINLLDYGGLVWQKCTSLNGTNHILQDSENGITSQYLSSDLTNPSTALSTAISSISTTGYTISSSALVNQSSLNYVSWTFRKAAKFFDIVKYTGNGSAQSIPHNLGTVPGMIIVKRISSSSTDWFVYHRHLGATKSLLLNLPNLYQTSTEPWNNSEPTSSVFTVGSSIRTNELGYQYIAYLFAHDTTNNGLVQCGFIENSGINRLISNLGWEPQFILFKDSTLSNEWKILDTTRGWSDSHVVSLSSNTADAHTLLPDSYGRPDTSGIYGKYGATSLFTSSTIYLAIRRNNKPTSNATKVYMSISRLGTSSNTVIDSIGFKPDLIVSHGRGNGYDCALFDRLRGRYRMMLSNYNSVESAESNTLTNFAFEDSFSCDTDNTKLVINSSSTYYIYWIFKRHIEIFDIVCDRGSSTPKNIKHGLSVEPELIIRKDRTTSYNWLVYCKYASGTIYLNSNNFQVPDFSLWLNGALQVNSAEFSVSGSAEINSNGDEFINYLFATKSGVSKVGKYIGNGSSQTINCDFSSGARFILIKSITNIGDWFVWDYIRGIVALNDPHLSLNTGSVEVTTDDSVDPYSSGFIVNENTATHINILNAEYIYLAFS